MFNLNFLRDLRIAELGRVLALIPPRSRVLEFGAGTGEQARLLSERGFDVVAIDLASSGYSADRVFPVKDYDGRKIPLPDSSIDVVFSSNVLEHVEDLETILSEFSRILTPSGFGIHIMPTPSWRFWTFVAGYPTSLLAFFQLFSEMLRPPDEGRRRAFLGNLKTIVAAVIPLGHGTSFEGLSEFWTFSSMSWRKRFSRHGMRVQIEQPLGLFYTGHMLMGRRISLRTRKALSALLGSATRLYVVQVSSMGTASRK